MIMNLFYPINLAKENIKMNNYTPKKAILDKAILDQPRWIPWFLEGTKKIPAVEWSDYNNRKPFSEITGNVGIIFDKAIDHLVGLDLDDCINDDNQYNAQAITALLLFKNKAYIERSISGKGLHFIFHANLNISFNAKPIEYYEQGRYFTFSGDSIPGSVLVPQWCQEEISQFILKYVPHKLSPKNTTPNNDIGLVSIPKVKEALSRISPDCNRGEWFTTACALHHEFEGEEKGFELFHEWSMKAKDKYKGEGDCRRIWDSLGEYSGTPTTIGSLFELAKYKESGTVYDYPLSDGNFELEHQKDDEKGGLTKPKWLTLSDLDSKLGPIEWLIKDYFEANTISIIWGDTMAFKSFLALEVCFCVAAGLSWHDQDVKQGAVLYVCGEGANGIARRIAGLKQKYGITRFIPLYVSAGSRDMIEMEAMQDVINYGKSLNTQINLVMIDTVNRNFSGEENSSKDVAKAYKNLDRIKDSFTCSIAMVHHTGKSGAIIRGSAAWVQNVDASYEMKRTGKTFYTSFIPLKMKDAALGATLSFEMTEIILNRKSIIDGRKSTSIIDEESTLLTTLISSKVDDIPVDNQRRKADGTTVLILKCLEENKGPTTKKQIEDYVADQGQAIDSVRVSLTRLTANGEINRVKQGVYEIPETSK